MRGSLNTKKVKDGRKRIKISISINVLIILLALTIASCPVVSQNQWDCSECHSNSDGFTPHVNGGDYCFNCHGSDPHKIHVGEGTINLECGVCHGNETQFKTSPQFREEAGENITCVLCHSPTDPVEPTDPRGNLVTIHLGRGKHCTVCHTEDMDVLHASTNIEQKELTTSSPAPTYTRKEITVGVPPWDSPPVKARVVKQILEDEGYEVELKNLDIGSIFQQMASNKLDCTVSAWLPVTHGEYWDQYEYQLEEVAVNEPDTFLGLVVPQYVCDAGITSVGDLKGNAYKFDGKIVGIEPGASIMNNAKVAIEQYGLKEYELVEGSTPTMLSSLEKAIESEDWIIVTMWQPHSAYSQFNLCNLKDSKEIFQFSKGDHLSTICRDNFAQDYPEVYDFFKKFQVSAQTQSDWIYDYTVKGEDPNKVAEEWIKHNPDKTEEWVSVFQGSKEIATPLETPTTEVAITPATTLEDTVTPTPTEAPTETPTPLAQTQPRFPYFPLAGLALIVAIVVPLVFVKYKRDKNRGQPLQGVAREKDASGKEPVASDKVKPEQFAGFPQQLLSKYEPLEFTGEGGFAKVFKVKRVKDGRTVAVKIPKITSEAIRRSFLKELSVWLHLDHKNIVKLYDADYKPVEHLEMEYVEGVEVDGKVIKDLEGYPKPVKESAALEMVEGIASGLKQAHDKGIVHRDLKPLNILLGPGLTPKVTDWGLARLAASTSTTTKGYSPIYVAPEQLDSEKFGEPDLRTDVYQLGLIFYELLTGSLPYEGYSMAEITGKIVAPDTKPAPPSNFNVNPIYDSVVLKCLDKKKENRYNSVEEFLEALKRVKEKQETLSELKKTLHQYKESLKKSRTSEELQTNKKMVVELLGKLAVLHAEMNEKTELLNCLEDLKFYTSDHIEELSKTIDRLEYMIKEDIDATEQFVDGVRNLVHKIRREIEKS